MINNYFLYKNIPELDLHGEISEAANILLNEFINDNIKMGNYLIKIVHGKGTYTLKRVVHENLRKNKLVKDYKTDIFNDGVTVVELIKD